MPSTTLYLSGIAKWVKVYPGQEDLKYGKKAVLDLYLDEESFPMFKASGSRIEVRENEDGKFIKLTRDVDKAFKDVPLGHPKVIDTEGKPFDKIIGNGSRIVAKTVIYDSKFGKGTRLEAVQVLDHVPYDEPNVDPNSPYKF